MDQETLDVYAQQQQALVHLSHAYRQAINSCGPSAVNKVLAQMKELDQTKVQFKVH